MIGVMYKFVNEPTEFTLVKGAENPELELKIEDKDGYVLWHKMNKQQAIQLLHCLNAILEDL